MFATITARGFGGLRAPVALDLAPKGHTTITGPTSSGKSTILALLTAPFTGELPAVTGEEPEVMLTTGGGVAIRRTPTAWSVALKGADPIRATSQATLAAVKVDGKPIAALVPAADPDLARAVILPGEWRRLYDADLGRPFRDLLLRVLPSVDLRGRILARVPGADVNDLTADTGGKNPRPVPASDAGYPEALVATLERRQTAANKAAAEAKGRAEATAAALARIRAEEVTAPASEDELRAAETVASTARAWDADDRAREAYRRDKAAYDARCAEIDAHRAALAKLGKVRPPPASTQTERMALDAASKALRAAEEAERNAAEQARIEAARAQAAQEARRAVAVPAPDASPGVEAVAPRPTSPPPTMFSALRPVRVHDCPCCTCAVDDTAEAPF